MAGFLIEDVDTDCNDDLNDEEDQGAQPVPHDTQAVPTSAGATAVTASTLVQDFKGKIGTKAREEFSVLEASAL
jgi:hypothetical protein